MKFIIVYVTTENLQQAEHIAETLIKEKLVACANIVPQMQSMYVWKDPQQIEKSSECILLLKTLHEKLEAIEERIQQIHTYEVPCVISFTMDQVSKKYSDWLANQIK